MKAEAFLRLTGIEGYAALLSTLLKEERPFRYTYMPLAQFAELTDIRERERVYWYEILERAHCSAITALLRLERWLSIIKLIRQ